MTPSPAMATARPSDRSFWTTLALSSGRTSASTSSMPSRAATARAVVRLSPVIITSRTPSPCSALTASGVEALIGSATPRIPASLPSTAAKITVVPSALSRSASLSRGPASTACSAMMRPPPSTTRRPSTTPSTPLPSGESNPEASERVRLRSLAARRIASARGCSEPRSRLAASRRSSASSTPGTVTIAVSAGRPSVRVPVLSTTRVSIRSSRSSASAVLISTPA